MGIIVDAISEQKVKSKIRKLENCRKDLGDDSGDINAINKNIESLISDVQRFIGASGSGPIEDILRTMKEPDQYSDKWLSEANAAIGREINYLRRGLEDGETCR